MDPNLGETPATATASPASTHASDSDVSARVYFGPLQSPEKKFVPDLARRRTLRPQSPTRRSSRLSLAASSPLRNDNESESDENDVDGISDEATQQSRSGTPENDFPQDEPSSVLADKIMHAHDNPSPPPQTRNLPDSTSAPPLEEDTPMHLIDISDSPIRNPIFQATQAFEMNGLDDKSTSRVATSPSAFSPPNETTALPALVLHEASPPAQLKLERPLANTSQHDLISFESFSTPSSSIRFNSTPDELLLEQPLRTSLYPMDDSPTIDELLFRTTTPASSPPRDRPPDPSHDEPSAQLKSPPCQALDPSSPRLNSAQSPSPAPASPSQDPERQDLPESVERATTPSPEFSTEDNIDHPIDIQSNLPNTIGSPVLPTVVPANTQHELHTPVRRSGRRSVTPSPLPVILTAPQHSPSRFATPPGHGQLLAPPSTAQTRKKRWKGKERALSPAAGESENDTRVELVREGSADEHEDSMNVSPGSEYQRSEDGENIRRANEEESVEKEKKREKEVEKAKRELRSLSPDSADVLSQLFPSSSKADDLAGNTVPDDPSAAVSTPPEDTTRSHTPARSAVTVFPPRPNSTVTATGARRQFIPPTPLRNGTHSSLSPTRLPSTLDDPTRTPARRNPLIEQALALGTMSVGKPGGMERMRSPVFTRQPLDDPLRSPARRIPVTEVLHGRSTTRAVSPVRSLPRERSGPAEPRGKERARERSGSAEPPRTMVGRRDGLSSSSATPRTATKLPFPLVAASVTGLPRSIPEESELLPTNPNSQNEKSMPSEKPAVTSSSSPAKSGLRQPSAGSRIPRIGAKPYARPPSASRKEKESKLPTISKKSNDTTTHLTKSISGRLTRTPSASESSSDDTSVKTVGHTSSRATNGSTESASNLKRKRGPEISSPSRPVVVIRQAGPGMLSKYAPKLTSTVPQSHVEASPAKKPIPPVPRRVVDGIFAKRSEITLETRPKGEADLRSNLQGQGETVGKHPLREDEGTVVSSSKFARKENTPPSSPILPDQSMSLGTHLADCSTTLSSPPDSDAESSGKVRRTTRIRQPVHLATDVFGTIAVRPLQPRRRPPTSRAEPVFAGMTAVALKALTTSNTTKNQQYLAAKLETEVIRKEGARPDSPVVKVRTILQRQQEEKSKGRKERADRRARRSDEGLAGSSDIDDYGDYSMADAEGSLDVDEFLHKHRRGPGDEEDYETPEKVDRSTKRIRLEEGEEDRMKKRVKWDRGLSTTIYLDEVHPNPKSRPKESLVIKKGCLAKTAKSLRLDTLGNHPNADAPLTDLVHENILVKKFVYDNDVDLSAPVVKVTRSKSKKMKA